MVESLRVKKKKIYLRSFDDNGSLPSTFLIFGILIAVFLWIANWALVDFGVDVDADDYVATEEVTAEEEKREWWDIWGHITDWIGGYFSGVVNVITLNVPILTNMGFVGSIIRIGWGCIITVGIVDLIWIG